MSTYYSGEDEKRKKQKEELPPKKDTSGSTFSEENIDSSDNDKHQTAETVKAIPQITVLRINETRTLYHYHKSIMLSMTI